MDGPIQIIDIHAQKRLEEERLRDLAFYGSQESVQKARGQHIMPAKDGRKRHTIMSLMVKAKEEAAYMDEQRANMKAARKEGKAKYGF